MSSTLDFQSSINEDKRPNVDVEMHTSSFDPISLYTYRTERKTVTKFGSNGGPVENELFRICYKGTRDPCWPNSLPLSPLTNNPKWAVFVETTDQIVYQTNMEIRSYFGGLSGYFLALANIIRPSVALTSTRSSERGRKIRQLPDQVSKQSLQEFTGSPSPPQPSSQESAYDPALSANNDDLEEEREWKQATVESTILTEKFISLVISLVIDVFLDQGISLEKRLAFQQPPTKLILANQDNTVNCKCFDDGSIFWHEFDPASQRWTLGEYVCSVMTRFVQGDEEGKGKISSEKIPEYACELIGVVMQRWTDKDLEMNVNRWQPLIVTHSCYMTILSATFTPPYLKYIMGAGNELDGDPPFLEIYSTKKHDLKTSVGRKNAAEDLLVVCEKLRADDRDKKVGDKDQGN